MLLQVALPTIHPDPRLLFAIDDTPTKRYEPHVQGAGIHHNPTPGPAEQKFVYGTAAVSSGRSGIAAGLKILQLLDIGLTGELVCVKYATENLTACLRATCNATVPANKLPLRLRSTARVFEQARSIVDELLKKVRSLTFDLRPSAWMFNFFGRARPRADAIGRCAR